MEHCSIASSFLATTVEGAPLPSHQLVSCLHSHHSGCRHPAVAEPEVLNDVGTRSKGNTHGSGDGADVIFPAR